MSFKFLIEFIPHDPTNINLLFLSYYAIANFRVYLLCLGDMVRKMTRVLRGFKLKSTQLAQVVSPFW